MREIINILLDLRSITQKSPCLNAFEAGQTTYYKIFETINKNLEIYIYHTNGLVFKDIHGDIEFKMYTPSIQHDLMLKYLLGSH